MLLNFYEKLYEKSRFFKLFNSKFIPSKNEKQIKIKGKYKIIWQISIILLGFDS